MGQKVNPNILRLGINKTWKTKFFEKKKQELPLYTFKDIEIKEYVERYLFLNGILLHDYKQYYTNSTLNLYISYFVSEEFNSKKFNPVQITLSSKGTNIKKNIKTLDTACKGVSPSSTQSHFETLTPLDFYKIQNYLRLNSKESVSDLYLSLPFGEEQSSKLFENSRDDNKESIATFKELFNVLNLFTKNRFNIVINFCCVNKDLNFLKPSQVKSFSVLQKYRNASFLKEGFELLFYTAYNKNSANLLAAFVAFQIKKIKRQKFFTSFLKQTLSTFMRSSLSQIKGIKIIIKGRLNGVPRAKRKTILIGDVPVQSIGETLDFAQKTVHNSSGSYGIKVWIVEKK